jgi:Fic family protein
MEITSPPKYSNSQFPLFPPATEAERGQQIVRASRPTDDQGRYWHWDKLRHLEPPHDWSVEEWWAGIKWIRNQKARNLPFVGKEGASFLLMTPGCIQAQLNWIEKNLKGHVQAGKANVDSIDRKAFLERAQMREAFSSSRLEGADVGWERVDKILGEGDEPGNLDEWMVSNNYRAIKYVRENTDQELSPEMIFELHRILTSNPVAEATTAGRFRNSGDDLCSSEKTLATAWHVPPAAQEIEERIYRLCSYANHPLEMADSTHPVIRAILIHLFFMYDQPFVDANGRVARALFYWAMLKSGYELAGLLSISSILSAVPGQYERSFRYVVTDENDTTYFVIHQLDVIIKALQNFWATLEGKSA